MFTYNAKVANRWRHGWMCQGAYLKTPVHMNQQAGDHWKHV